MPIKYKFDTVACCSIAVLATLLAKLGLTSSWRVLDFFPQLRIFASFGLGTGTREPSGTPAHGVGGGSGKKRPAAGVEPLLTVRVGSVFALKQEYRTSAIFASCTTMTPKTGMREPHRLRMTAVELDRGIMVVVLPPVLVDFVRLCLQGCSLPTPVLSGESAIASTIAKLVATDGRRRQIWIFV